MPEGVEGARPAPRLSEFLRHSRDDIVRRWLERARRFPSARGVPLRALIAPVVEGVERLADLLETGYDGAGEALRDLSRRHAEQRLASGFRLADVVEEYSLLRRTIFDSWIRRVGAPLGPGESRRLSRAIDLGIRETAEQFARARDERESELLGLADHIAQLAWMADARGSIYWYNRRWYEYTGTTPEEMAGWGWQKVHHPEHLARVLEQWRRCLRTGTAWEDTFPLRGRDGGYRWFLSRAIPIRDEGGRVVRWLGTNTDVTERLQTEEELRRAEERLRLAVEATELGLWDWNPQKGEAHWSPEQRRIAGPPPELWAGGGWSLKQLHPDDRAMVQEAIRRAFDPAGDGRLDVLARVVREADGETRWAHFRGQASFDESGRPARLVGTTLDVTERKRAEETARFLSEAAGILASSLDCRKTLTEICRLAVPRLADWAFVTLVRSDGGLEDLAAAHVDPARIDAVLRFARRREGPLPETFAGVVRSGQPLLRGDGWAALERIGLDEEERRVLSELGLRSYLIAPMVARARVIGAFTLVAATRRYGEDDRDAARHLARRAALAVENARLYDEAQEAVRQRELLLAVVSHDLRNPLQAVRLDAGLLARGRARGQGERILRAVSRMERLIGDLLDFASLHAGRLEVRASPEGIGAIVDELLEIFQPQAAEKTIALQLDAEAARGLRVRADRNRVLQVLANLLGNALKFCGPGAAVTLSIAPRDGELLFAVKDSGPGMSEEERGHLFEPYWSADRHRAGGTGLGLYISKGIVEAHGGRIWAESAPGRGSAFYFTLPRA